MKNIKGFASVPVIIGIVTVVVFIGIVIAAIRQEQRTPQPNPELEQQLQQFAEEPAPVDKMATTTGE